MSSKSLVRKRSWAWEATTPLGVYYFETWPEAYIAAIWAADTKRASDRFAADFDRRLDEAKPPQPRRKWWQW